MFDIVALDELLIGFTYCGRSENGVRLFEQNPGGASANMLRATSNLGSSTAFIGKVGRDMHGDYLRRVLEEKGADTGGLISAEDVFTTLAFVELSEAGERKFSFARKSGTDTCLTACEIKRELLEGCRIFHLGSLSLTDEPSRSATIEAVKVTEKAGAVISYDPNHHAPLWKSEDEATEIVRSVLSFADVVRISDEEVGLITGESSSEAAAGCLFQKGIFCAVVTLDSNGAYATVEGASALASVSDIPVVDTTDAGDAFWGSFLYQLAMSGLRPNKLGKAQLRGFTEFVNAVTTLCVQERGGVPAMPTINMVRDFLDRKEG